MDIDGSDDVTMLNVPLDYLYQLTRTPFWRPLTAQAAYIAYGSG